MLSAAVVTPSLSASGLLSPPLLLPLPFFPSPFSSLPAFLSRFLPSRDLRFAFVVLDAWRARENRRAAGPPPVDDSARARQVIPLAIYAR